MEIWIGVDSGIEGAACILAGRQRPRVVMYNRDLGSLFCALSRELVRVRAVPSTVEPERPRLPEEFEAARPRPCYADTRVLIEPPHSRMRDKVERGPALLTSGRCWGHWEMVLVSLGINQDHIRSVHPASWKTACGLRKMGKRGSINWCKRFDTDFPLKVGRMRVDNDNIADARCIAEVCKRTQGLGPRASR